MERSMEEVSRLHKETCKILKKARADMATQLGITLHQGECTFQGHCKGTCLACEREEKMLNEAMEKQQWVGKNRVHKAVVIGAVSLVVLGISGCSSEKVETIEGKVDTEYVNESPTKDVEPYVLEGEVVESVEES